MKSSTIAHRLAKTLKDQDRSIRWLHQHVKGVRGASYGSVHAYVTGNAKAEPPLEFLRAAAKALNIAEVWLISGLLMGGPLKLGEFGDARALDPQGDKMRAMSWGLSDSVWSGLGFQPDLHTLLSSEWEPVIDYVRLLYELRGPAAFGVAWTGEWEPKLAADEWGGTIKRAVAEHVTHRFGPLLSWPPTRPESERRATMHGLLAANYAASFGQDR